MTVAGWVALGVYVAGYPVVCRVMYRMTDGDDQQDRALLAVFVGLIWPAALAVVAVIGLLALPMLGARSKKERAAERDKRIAELEAENASLALQQETGITPEAARLYRKGGPV